jgi:hypothetical protein
MASVVARGSSPKTTWIWPCSPSTFKSRSARQHRATHAPPRPPPTRRSRGRVLRPPTTASRLIYTRTEACTKPGSLQPSSSQKVDGLDPPGRAKGQRADRMPQRRVVGTRRPSAMKVITKRDPATTPQTRRRAVWARLDRPPTPRPLPPWALRSAGP